MKTIKSLLVAFAGLLAVAAFTPATSKAAVTHDLTLSGTGLESLWLSDSEWNFLFDSSTAWTAEVFVQDDADGSIVFTYSGGDNTWIIEYAVSANAETWELASAWQVIGFTNAMIEVTNLLYPL